MVMTHGLLSTTALLDLFQVGGERRFEIESQWRPASMNIEHPDYGTAVIRDQKPMPPESLQDVLIGVTPQEWYEFLNNKVFFWSSQDRLQRLLKAVAYRQRSHTVITVDTRALVEKHADRITLSTMNSGVSLFDRRKRGLSTFQTLDEFPTDPAASRHPPQDVVEVAVEYSVPHIVKLTVNVSEWLGDRKLMVIQDNPMGT